jgi:hypothetical protein
MKRREFITLIGGAAAWPLAAQAQQQGDRVRRIGVLVRSDENDPEQKRRLSAFTQALAGLGWTDGRNMRMDLRWAGDDANRMRALAHELVGLQPDIILTGGTPETVAVQRETRTIPIVFPFAADPVASGLVERLDRPSVRPSINKINELRSTNFSNPRIRPRSGGRFSEAVGAPRTRGSLPGRARRENATGIDPRGERAGPFGAGIEDRGRAGPSVARGAQQDGPSASRAKSSEVRLPIRKADLGP